MNITVRKNEAKNGIEIYFPSKPSPAILSLLKSNGWGWSRFSKCWYKKQSAQAFQFAEQLAGNKVEEGEDNSLANYISAQEEAAFERHERPEMSYYMERELN